MAAGDNQDELVLEYVHDHPDSSLAALVGLRQRGDMDTVRSLARLCQYGLVTRGRTPNTYQVTNVGRVRVELLRQWRTIDA